MTTITLGVQCGDERSSIATRPHFMEMRALLRAAEGDYSSEIDKLAIVLRIDGSISHWNFEGLEKLRLARKRRYVTVDIGVPQCRWDCPPQEFRAYLGSQVRSALEAMVDRIRKGKLNFCDEPFWLAVNAGLAQFERNSGQIDPVQ